MKTTFGEYLRTIREEREVSLRDLAGYLRVSAPYLCDVEYGRRRSLDYEKLNLISNYLRLDKETEHELFIIAAREKLSEFLSDSKNKHICMKLKILLEEEEFKNLLKQ